MVLGMVKRGEFLPDVQQVHGGYRARWSPLWLAGTRQQLADLAAAMPPVCRALAPCGKTSLRPAASAETVLAEFISTMVDQLVRLAAGQRRGEGGGESVRRALSRNVRTGGENVYDQFLQALQETGEPGDKKSGRGTSSRGQVAGMLHGPGAKLAQLAAAVQEWQRPLILSHAAPFKLTFRLEEHGVGSPTSAETIEPNAPAELVGADAMPAPVAADGPQAAGSETVVAAAGVTEAGAAAAVAETGAAAVATGAGAGWYVRYFLQSRADPSLLIPAEEVWQRDGRLGPVLQSAGLSGAVAAAELLLVNLGRAARLCPEVAESLRQARPSGFALDTQGAYRFLTERAPGLEEAGFGLLLPAWWVDGRTKLRPAVRARVVAPKVKGGGFLSLDDVVRFDWQIALGDEPLTLAELNDLARLKLPLVQIRGQWVQIDPEEIRALSDFLKKRAPAQATAREALVLALGGSLPAAGSLAADSHVDVKVEFGGSEEDEGGSWLGELLAQLEGKTPFAELPPPRGFVGTLRPYQRRGYSRLAFLARWGLGACLADDMGLGKTVQTLALVQRFWEEGQAETEAAARQGPAGDAAGPRSWPAPVLLICPTSVVNNWRREAARFTPGLPVLVHHGPNRCRGDEFVRAVAGKALVISSYALLARDVDTFQRVHWSGVILDEAQNIKNPETRQAKAARSLTAEYRIALTGTPVENNVGDLWSIMEFLNPGYLGSQAQFQRRFFIPIQMRRDVEATSRLQRLTRPFILRRLKTDRNIITDLPDKIETKVYCGLTKEQASLYQAVVKDVERRLDETSGMERKGLILATLTKLKQICNHPAHFLGDRSSLPGRSGKLNRLTEIIEEILAVGDRALIFTQFTEMGELLQQYLEEQFGREVLFLHGGVPKRRRDEMVERFEKDDDGPPLFVLSLKAGGTGLNLVRANHVFHFDRWWNPAVENQATDRAFRIGQVRAVQVHKFVCVGTVEEKIDEMIESKLELAGRIVGTGEGWLTELSTDQLRELFALRKDAIG
ncbi:MAG: DEAD/DEAH box helicase [Limnochordales bacterium]|nr:DEAD/DEAH box helicase [Limnochordales bacterium]